MVSPINQNNQTVSQKQSATIQAPKTPTQNFPSSLSSPKPEKNFVRTIMDKIRNGCCKIKISIRGLFQKVRSFFSRLFKKSELKTDKKNPYVEIRDQIKKEKSHNRESAAKTWTSWFQKRSEEEKKSFIKLDLRSGAIDELETKLGKENFSEKDIEDKVEYYFTHDQKKVKNSLEMFSKAKIFGEKNKPMDPLDHILDYLDKMISLGS